jgi:hypothetical protein
VAGRKRSRDEASVNLDSPEKVVEPPILEESDDEWVYGPGMVLIKRNGYVADASSQSGTWVEERAAEEEKKKTEAALLEQQQSRPSLRSHKSQRIESAENNRSSPVRDMANPNAMSSDQSSQPVVDAFTVHLGIGWSRISTDEHIQAAARGWARYIENHFPINDARIQLESRGLQSYLVEANEGFFLFSEDLRQGRLVSKDADRALQNLKTSPPIFDGETTMEATETPKPSDSLPEFIDAAANTTNIDVDMN